MDVVALVGSDTVQKKTPRQSTFSCMLRIAANPGVSLYLP